LHWPLCNNAFNNAGKCRAHTFVYPLESCFNLIPLWDFINLPTAKVQVDPVQKLVKVGKCQGKAEKRLIIKIYIRPKLTSNNSRKWQSWLFRTFFAHIWPLVFHNSLPHFLGSLLMPEPEKGGPNRTENQKSKCPK